MFRFLTTGESHGPCLTAVIEGLPANFSVNIEQINEQLRRRQGGYGRGARMRMEQDHVAVLSGIRHGKTMGSPITFQIENKDWQNWQEKMSAAPVDAEIEKVTRVRPGHADFTGAVKYGQNDIRNIIERSSSRETASRVAVGAICRQFLAEFGIQIHSHVVAIGPFGDPYAGERTFTAEFWQAAEESPVRCGDAALSAQMIHYIDEIQKSGDTAGGIFEVVAQGVAIGLGSFSQWDRRLSTRIGMVMMSIPSSKGVEIGGGFGVTRVSGSQVHDVLRHENNDTWSHLTNNAGGIEGGISNGEPIVVRVGLKPIPTLAKPLPSVDLATGENIDATRYERSDVCVVPAGGVVGEAMLAIALAEAFLEKYGGDSIEEVHRHYEATLAINSNQFAE